jgi:hypothetical protein
VFDSIKSATDKLVATDKEYSKGSKEYAEVYKSYKEKEQKLMEIFK